MTNERKVDRVMIGGSLVFGALGLKMVIEGIMHTISGTPIPATSWTPESSGPEQLFFGLVALALGAVALRRGLRGESAEQ